MKKRFSILILLLTFLTNSYGQDAATTKLFFSALEQANYEKIDKYLESIVDINQVFYTQTSTPRGHNGKYNSKESTTPLIKALELKNTDLVNFLIEKGADVNKEVAYEEFEYCKTCGYGEWLRKQKTHRPISRAIASGELKLIDALVNSGASFKNETENIKSKASLPLLKYFSEKRDFPITYSAKDLEKLFKKKYGQPRADFVSYLIDEGVVPTPLTVNRLVKNKNRSLVKKAIDAGAKVNGYEKDGKYSMCALCQSVLVCDEEMTKMLVEEYNANVNAICSFYWGGATVISTVNPIQISTDKYVGKCKGRNTDLTELLIFAKAKQEKENKTVSTNSNGDSPSSLNTLIDTRWSGSHTYKIYPNTPSQIIKSDPIKIEFVSNGDNLEAIVTRDNSAGDPYEGITSKTKCSVRFDGSETVYLDHKEWIKKDRNAHKKEANFILNYTAAATSIKGEIVQKAGSNHSMNFTVRKKKSKKRKRK